MIKDEDSSPLPAFVIRADIEEQRKDFSPLFTKAQSDLSMKVYLRAAAIYNCRVFRNYRENFISVKVEKPNVMDKNSDEAIALNEFCLENGVELHPEKKNLIYRIRRT